MRGAGAAILIRPGAEMRRADGGPSWSQWPDYNTQYTVQLLAVSKHLSLWGTVRPGASTSGYQGAGPPPSFLSILGVARLTASDR